MLSRFPAFVARQSAAPSFPHLNISHEECPMQRPVPRCALLSRTEESHLPEGAPTIISAFPDRLTGISPFCVQADWTWNFLSLQRPERPRLQRVPAPARRNPTRRHRSSANPPPHPRFDAILRLATRCPVSWRVSANHSVVVSAVRHGVSAGPPQTSKPILKPQANRHIISTRHADHRVDVGDLGHQCEVVVDVVVRAATGS